MQSNAYNFWLNFDLRFLIRDFFLLVFNL